jgi:superfamily II DNA or RNA helicase
MNDIEDLLTLIGQQVILAGHFDVPVNLEDIRAIGSGYECRVRLPDGTPDEVILSCEELNALLADRPSSDKINSVNPEKLQLLIESTRIRLAYAHDKQFAVSLSGIRTLPHQIEAVYQKMLPQPRLRFLLADDPGAGKTIMAGLLIKEMKLREAIERILILCPAPLTPQWQDEMLRWFGETFDIIFSAVDQYQLVNPWQKSNQVIASIDYAKQEDVRERIWQQKWNLVIIDEAHKCSARSGSGGLGKEQKIITTKRYDLASRLTYRADHVLLLTATPHHGDEDKFAHFLRLIDPDLFPEPHRLSKQAATIRKEVFKLGKDCPWALRRLKEDLKDLHGKRLFPDRHVKTVTFSLNSDEYALYKAVSSYINHYIAQQANQRKGSAALARTVFQRRLASSTYAIYESLKRRLKKQEELLEELEALPPAQRAKRISIIQGKIQDIEQDDDDLDDDAREQIVDDFSGAQEIDQIRSEIMALKGLVEQARSVRDQAQDSKLAALKQCLSRAQFSELKDGRGKLLIFTEHRDTLNYIRGHIERWGYTTCEIHGSMNPHERKRAQEAFRTQAQICVATEAAGEGINLQFCHLMINYDMPWNPTRLEQRLGRIHRIGQDRDVFAFNFVATDSEDGQPVIEGRILICLLDKLEQMREALEGRVFDVIGEVLSLNDVNLPEMLREAAYDPRRLDEYIDQIEKMDPDKLKEYEEATGIALARSNVDFTDFQERNLEIEERRLMPRYVEAQFISAAREVGLQIEPRADGLWRIEHVPAELRSDRLESVGKLGKAETSYRKVTFHKQHLEQDAHIDAILMGPGHPLYAAVDERLNQILAPLTGGIGFFIDPMSLSPYRLHFFEIIIKGKDSRGNEIPLHGELVAVKEEDGEREVVPSDTILDLAPCKSYPQELDRIDFQPAADSLKSTYQLECRDRCHRERQHFAEVVRSYLLESFKIRIQRAQERAMQLRSEERLKPEFKLAADEAFKHVNELLRTREERLAGLSRLEIARTGPVRHVATALIVPPGASGDTQIAEMFAGEDPEIRRRSELAAEDAVIRLLIEEGFPEERIERVGHLKLGFDIRAHRVKDYATGEIEVKRIEVKGRMSGQPIRLTVNEWYKAQQLSETYWLSVVWDPLGSSPKVVSIQNPAVKLDHVKKEIVAARYYEIPAESIRTF